MKIYNIGWRCHFSFLKVINLGGDEGRSLEKWSSWEKH